jgi:hypothetical protein
MTQRNFLAELKRRNVYKVAVAYAVVSWLLIQIATQVFRFFNPFWDPLHKDPRFQKLVAEPPPSSK